jgi:mono/diheme cytochrome c family protein
MVFPSNPARRILLQNARSQAATWRERRMNRGVVALMFLLAAWPNPAAAQTAGAGPHLDAAQLAGRNLFTQHCVVCHVKTLMTAVRTYGPALSKESLGGQDDVLRELIGNGTPNMPGFKYSLEPGEIGTIIAYLKTLPTQPPAAPR